MSDALPPLPPSLQPPPPAPEQEAAGIFGLSRRNTIVAGAGVIGILALLGVAATVVFGSSPDRYPSDWDPRVVDLVAAVEHERELDFEHPVFVDFLTSEEYSDATRTDEAALTDEDRASLEDAGALLRALGLVSGDVDLFESGNELSDTGTLAYYDDITGRITVRGTELTVDLQVTLVHELTHALQDQHFDLGRLHELESSEESTAFRAVVEGDASLVEERYVAGLDPEDAEEYAAALDEQVEAAPLDDVPSILTASFGAPYVLGTPLVGVVQAEGGWSAVDDMLEVPPTSEVELLDPLIHLAGFVPRDVELPELADDQELIEEGDFGAITLYLMLAASMDVDRSFEVAEGWGGDTYRTERDGDGRLCTVMATAGVTPPAADALEDALTEWAASAADTDASVERQDDVVTLRSCDPGTEFESTPVNDPLDALAFPATRSYVILGAVQQGLTPEVGGCVGDAVVDAVPLEVLADPEPSDDELDTLFEVMGKAGTTCAVGG